MSMDSGVVDNRRCRINMTLPHPKIRNVKIEIT